MTDQPGIHVRELDDQLTVLADRLCRFTVAYFRDASDDVATVEELATEMCTSDSDKEHVKLWLHHSALPRLADHGVIDYDARSHTVRYQADSALESLVDSIN